jgi:hypothetical protein
MFNLPVVDQPENYKRPLFEHQKTSIYFMEHLEKSKHININNLYNIETNFGIQADITGYGKTASMIGLIVRNKMKWDKNLKSKKIIKVIYSTNPSGYKITKNISLKKIKTTLIIVSQSLVSQWRDELKLSELTFEIVRTNKKASEVNAEEFDVILCTPTMYNKLINRYSNVIWKRMLYDEPETTQIPSMKNIYAEFTWFITATPDLLKWRYSSRRNHHIARLLLHQLQNIFFNALQIKNPIDYIKQSYNMPPVRNYIYDCFQPISRAVMGFVPRRVEVMIEAGNIRGAIQYLGGNETDNIVNLVKSRFQEELNDAQHKIERYTLRGDESRIQEWTEKKTRIEKRINELDIRFENALQGTCNICFSSLTRPALVPCCQHLFCGKCIMKWVGSENNCPLCRTVFPISDLTYIKKDTESELEPRNPNKTQQIIKIIKSNKNGRFIIFSEEDATYINITQELINAKIICKEIKGRSESREKIINQFKSGKINVIFLNSKNNGAGINLQECSDIILYHKMNSLTQTQIIGRANRIGRINELNIHHLHVSN